jgi:acetylornithine deacetylase/succinyl-diaminopimelate desuccinylase-like protein
MGDYEPLKRDPDTDWIPRKVHDMMPEVLEDLKDLIRYPSVAFPGYPPEPVLKTAGETAALLRRYGLENVRLIEFEGGFPAIYGEIPPPPGAPTVLLYAHYDVQPARKEDGWELDPWMAVVRDGRLYGRGAADDKSGIMIIAASLGVFNGKIPVGVKVIIEGEEETPGHLEDFVATHPEFFRCDVFVVTDSGNLRTGEPALTMTLRGEVSCVIQVETLDHALHSGSFGGAVPDALVSLIRILATLHDSSGDTVVPGLRSGPDSTTDYPEELYRRSAGLLTDGELIGTGPLADRLWSKPSANVIGIDAPSIREASNILIPRAAAKVSLRISPDADPSHEVGLLMDHLRAAAPWHVRVNIRKESTNPGFICPSGGQGFAAAARAMGIAFGKPAGRKGSGGSIPLLQTLRQAVPGAEFILWGAQDAAGSRIHGTDESVDIAELERFIVAQSLFLQFLGTTR